MNSDDKLYLDIKEVAEKFEGMEDHTLRNWEKAFPMLRPKRSGSGGRLYSKADLELVAEIHYLVKIKKMKLAGAMEEIKRRKGDDMYRKSLVTRLTEIKGFLQQMRDEL